MLRVCSFLPTLIVTWKLMSLYYSCPHKGRFSLFRRKLQQQEVVDVELERAECLNYGGNK